MIFEKSCVLCLVYYKMFETGEDRVTLLVLVLKWVFYRIFLRFTSVYTGLSGKYWDAY